MKWSSQKNILFQVEVIKLCSKLPQKTVDNVENHTESKTKSADTATLRQESKKEENEQAHNSANKKTVKDTQNYADTVKKMSNWNKIVGDLKQSGKILLYTNLINSNAVEINDMTIGISFPKGLTPFGKSILEKPENINELSRLVSIEYGKDMRVKIVENLSEIIKTKEDAEIESMAGNLDIPINIIDE